MEQHEDTLVANDLQQDDNEPSSQRNDLSELKPRKAMARRHLRLLGLDPDIDTATFQVFDDNKQRLNTELAALKAAGKPEIDPRARTICGTLDDCWAALVGANQDGRAVHITVNKTNGRRRRKEDFLHGRAVFIEADSGLPDKLPVTPTLKIESSSGKYHVYFISDDPLSLEDFTAMMQRSVVSYGSDPKAMDCVRVLRLAGFYHLKDPDHPHVVTIIEENVDGQGFIASYSRKQLQAAFPPLNEVEKKKLKELKSNKKPAPNKDRSGENTGLGPAPPNVEARRKIRAADYSHVLGHAKKSRSRSPWDDKVDAIVTIAHSKARAYIKGALIRELETLAAARKPGRNAQVNACAFSGAQLLMVKLGGHLIGAVDEDGLCDLITEAAEQCGTTMGKVPGTIDSGIRSGTAQPRDLDKVLAVAGDEEPAATDGNPDTTPTGGLPTWCRYRPKDGYVVQHEKDEEGIAICSKIEFVARARKDDNLGNGVLIRVHQADGAIVELFISSEIAVDEKKLRAKLADAGVWMEVGRGSGQRLLCLFRDASPKRFMLRAEKPGWLGDAFVLRDTVIQTTGGEQVLFTGDPLRGEPTAGTLDSWKKNVAAPMECNAHCMMAVGVMLASPLLRLVGEDGAVFHFVGPSSRGKTTIGKAALSVFAGPTEMMSWRMTDNAAEGGFEAHNDLGAVIDELKQAQPEAAAQVAYMYGNGQGKRRMNGDSTSRPIARWLGYAVSTGETSLEVMIARLKIADSYSAGQSVRFIEMLCGNERFGAFERVPPGMDGRAFSKAIVSKAVENYGTAGRAYIEYLVKDKARTTKRARRIVRAFERTVASRAGSDPQVGRVATKFGVVLAGLTLAVQAHVLPWSFRNCKTAVLKCFVSWLTQRGHAGGHERHMAIQLIDSFLAQHDARFEDRYPPTPPGHTGPLQPPTIHNKAGFKEYQGPRNAPTKVIYSIFPTAFQEACKGSDPTTVAKYLHAAGRLVKNQKGPHWADKVQLPGKSGAQRVYVVEA